MADNVSGRIKPRVDIGQRTSQEKGMKSVDTSFFNSSEEVKIESIKYGVAPVHKSLKDVTIQYKESGVTSLCKSSEEYYEYNCDPCKDVGEYAEGVGFCTDCKNYLCIACFYAHSRSKLSKHHVFLDTEDMPRNSQKVCNPCKTFGEEIQALGYCEDCSDFLCENCYKCHRKSKLTRNHVLDKTFNDREEVDEIDVTTSVTKLNIMNGTTGGVMTNEEYTYVRDINVESDTDKSDCFITGMTLVSSNELVLCDRTNKCLKLLDIDKNKIKDVLALQSCPNGITTLSNDQVAVVLSIRSQIQIVTARDKLTLDRTIKTNGQCLYVKMMNKHLYVSFMEPVKFQILQPTGAIIKTIKPDDEVLQHCIFPRYMAVSPDESVIYVSDLQTNKVLSLDRNGNIIALYQEELDHPEDIIIAPSGSVYTCNTYQNMVYKMTSDLSEATIILGLGDGLVFPQAMCFETKNQCLYISSASAKRSNNLKVYNCLIR